VHRDIKLENVLLESKASDSPIKLIDFGTSRVYNPEEKLTRRIGTVININALCSRIIWHLKYS
jgi:calcium-dependent protein kinase